MKVILIFSQWVNNFEVKNFAFKKELKAQSSLSQEATVGGNSIDESKRRKRVTIISN